MKLFDIMEKKEEEKKEELGTYAGVRFDDDTIKRIKAYAIDNEIPDRLESRKLHTTLLYSKKHLPDYVASGDLDEPLIGKPTGFDVWESQPDDEGIKSNCLILLYDCSELVKRHKDLMSQHEAEYDFDEYKPHITLSYNIGDLDVSKLNAEDIGDINITTEYQEELNIGWAKENTND